MNNQAFLYGIIGLLGGSLLTIIVATNAVNSNNQGMMRMMGMRMLERPERQIEQKKDPMGMGSSMNEMMNSLSGKTGDEFDKAFISAMIAHHEGAIEMAQDAKTDAKHEEIKEMADDIISAQSKEIEMMREWRMKWGY